MSRLCRSGAWVFVVIFIIGCNAFESRQQGHGTQLWEKARVTTVPQSVNLDQIDKIPFHVIDPGKMVPSFGFTDEAVLMRFNFANSTENTKWVLTIDHIYLDSVTLYQKSENAFQVISEFGLSKMEPTEIPYYGYALPLEIPSGTEKDFLLKASSKYPISLPIFIEPSDNFFSRVRNLDYVIGGYLAAIIVLILYNFFIYLSSRDKSYLYYIFSLLSLHLFTNLTQFGVTRQWFNGVFPGLYTNIFYFAHFFPVVFVHLFVNSFFDIGSKHPRLKWVLKVLVFANVPLLMLGFYLQNSLPDSLFQLNTTAYALTLLVASYLCAIEGQRPALFFAISWTTLILAWVLNFLRIDGYLIPSSISTYGILAGALMEGLLLSFALADRLRRLESSRKRLESEVSEANARAMLAQQVAHDIRSPLTALEVVGKDIDELAGPRERLFGLAVSRIKDIANELLVLAPTPTKPGIDNKSHVYVVPIIDGLVSEKKGMLGKSSKVKFLLNLDRESAFSVVEINPSSLSRALSNLLNNAIEASGEFATIKISIQLQGPLVILKISDNGSGMPEEVLNALGSRCLSHNKSEKRESGFGLGVSYATRVFKKAGGDLSFISIEGVGTTASIQLPAAPKYPWLIERISIPNSVSVINVIDDDPSVYEVWLEKFRSFGQKVRLHYFSNLNDFEGLERSAQEITLVDYNFKGYARRGTEVAEKLFRSGEKVFLMTSHFQDEAIEKFCQATGVPLIPKPLIAHLQISIDDLQGSVKRNQAFIPAECYE